MRNATLCAVVCLEGQALDRSWIYLPKYQISQTRGPFKVWSSLSVTEGLSDERHWQEFAMFPLTVLQALTYSHPYEEKENLSF